MDFSVSREFPPPPPQSHTQTLTHTLPSALPRGLMITEFLKHPYFCHQEEKEL